MKRYGNLYQQITDIENVKKAIKSASKGKQNRRKVKHILDNIDDYSIELQSLLIDKKFKPSPYIVEKITDKASRKERIIYKPSFYPDQCVHWCLMLIVEPLFKKRLYEWSCASIKGKGIHYAKNYIKGALRDKKNTKYAYQLDIRKFYPSINNEILKSKLRRMFKDNDVLWLFDTIIDSSKGLPIGNYTNQWLANFYLDDLDKFIKQKLHVPYYARYADDMILFSSNKRELHHNRKLIEDFINNDGLNVKDNWKVYKVDSRPVSFIGFTFYRDHITLRDNIYLRIKRRAKKISKKDYLTVADARGMTAYWGYISNTDSHKFYISTVKPLCDINYCRRVISNETKKHEQNQSALLYR